MINSKNLNLFVCSIIYKLCNYGQDILFIFLQWQIVSKYSLNRTIKGNNRVLFQTKQNLLHLLLWHHFEYRRRHPRKDIHPRLSQPIQELHYNRQKCPPLWKWIGNFNMMRQLIAPCPWNCNWGSSPAVCRQTTPIDRPWMSIWILELSWRNGK